MTDAPFQLLPALTEDELDALREDIRQNGILVPVIRDQHGRTLDGHHRQAIADELALDCPTVERHVADDDEAGDLAVTLNSARRHLTREQQRALVRNEILRRPEDADRAVARRVGCSPTTVGYVRAGMAPQPMPSKLDSPAAGPALHEAPTKNETRRQAAAEKAAAKRQAQQAEREAQQEAGELRLVDLAERAPEIIRDAVDKADPAAEWTVREGRRGRHDYSRLAPPPVLAEAVEAWDAYGDLVGQTDQWQNWFAELLAAWMPLGCADLADKLAEMENGWSIAEIVEMREAALVRGMRVPQ